jgi:hypothetical protein
MQSRSARWRGPGPPLLLGVGFLPRRGVSQGEVPLPQTVVSAARTPALDQIVPCAAGFENRVLRLAPPPPKAQRLRGFPSGRRDLNSGPLIPGTMNVVLALLLGVTVALGTSCGGGAGTSDASGNEAKRTIEANAQERAESTGARRQSSARRRGPSTSAVVGSSLLLSSEQADDEEQLPHVAFESEGDPVALSAAATSGASSVG